MTISRNPADPPAPAGNAGNGITAIVILAWVSCIVSVAGVLLAVWIWPASHGHRGGAIGVALTFLMLILGRNTPRKVMDLLPSRLPPAGVVQGEFPDPGSAPAKAMVWLHEEGERLKEKLDRTYELAISTRAGLSSYLDQQRKEKVPLIWSSIISTLVAGFGDYMAAILRGS